MDKAEYKGLISNPDYYSVGFGMLIMPADYIDKYGALSPETVFGENAVYNPEDEGDGVKIIGLYSDELHEYHADNSEMCFYGAITNIKDYNICREFVGAGYIKVKGAFGVKYKFAADNDNKRSAVYVAQRALRAGGYDEISREILNGYVSAAAEEETFYTVETYLCADKTVL